MVRVWFWLVGIKFGFFICFLYCWFRFDYVGLYLVWFCIVFDFVGLCLVLLDCVWFCWVVFGLVMYCVWFCQFVCDFEFFCDSFGFVFAFSFICLYLVLVCVLYGLVFAFGFVDLRLIWFNLVWFGLVHMYLRRRASFCYTRKIRRTTCTTNFIHRKNIH